MRINKENREFIEEILTRQRFFFTDELPWQWFNYENGRWYKEKSIHTRCEYLFTENGFFAETLKEQDSNYTRRVQQNPKDESWQHRQIKYIAEEFINSKGVFNNPLHISIGKRKTQSLQEKTYPFPHNSYRIICHPGHTRFRTSVFLQQNPQKAIITMRRDEFNDKIVDGMRELKTPDDFLNLWKPLPLGFKNKPTENHYLERANAEFIFKGEVGFETRGMKNKTKYHAENKCNVLKLWKLRDSVNNEKDLNHTGEYISEVYKRPTDISKIILEKTLTIYTNSDKDVESIFKQNRKHLVESAKIIRSKKVVTDVDRNLNWIHLINEFNFVVKHVPKKPKNISQYNGNRGFAIWIDNDRVNDITREIYEFLYYTRWDVKSAETEDGKISVVNCSTSKTKKWIISENFLDVKPIDLKKIARYQN